MYLWLHHKNGVLSLIPLPKMWSPSENLYLKQTARFPQLCHPSLALGPSDNPAPVKFLRAIESEVWGMRSFHHL